MKLNKTNMKHCAVYIVIYMLLVLALTRFKYCFGSTLDWLAQHYAIPDYFRKLFYDTGDLFPSFAMNIGGGESIYNLSYYGLYSPIILFSYLLPFVPMHLYIQAVSVIGVIAGTIIFYRWMCRKFGDTKIAFLLGLIYMFATPVMFHSHRHIMFTSYMPFLLLAFMAVEDYFAGLKKYKLVLFSFLTVMCCYFYAVSSLCAITVYAVYQYLKTTDKVTLKDFAKKGSHFAGRIITAVFMSAVLLAPTFYCMLSGRDKANVKPMDLKILLPGIKLNTFLFDSYSMGLGVFAIAAIVCAVIAKEKHRRFLGIAFSVLGLMPIFIYALNGFIYFDGKVMIAFMPLCVILIGYAYNDILNRSFKWKIVIPAVLIYCILGLIMSEAKGYAVMAIKADMVIFVVCMAVYFRKNFKSFLYFAMCGCTIISSVLANFNDKLTPIESLREIQSEDIKALAAYAGEQGEFVRTGNGVSESNSVNTIYNIDYLSPNIYSSLHNKKYNHFYFEEIFNENACRNSALTIQSKNILWDIYMSNKYLILKNTEKAPSGYEKVKTSGEFILYKNDNVLPLGYASSNVIDIANYEKSEYPYSVDILLNNIVAENVKSNFKHSEIEETEPFSLDENKSYDNGEYVVNNERDVIKAIKLPRKLNKNEILFISFNVDNDSKIYPHKKGKGDALITINGIKNKLTNPEWKYYNNNTRFEYTITTNGNEDLDYLTVSLGAGNYKISNIKCSVMSMPDLKDTVDPFVADINKTKGDNIVGDIDVKNDGYFQLSVPYADGFKVTVDGSEVKPELVDTAFLGFKIDKGKHHIEIEFKAPMLREGIITSAVGFSIFIILILREVLKNKKK